jgi:hypothetical protein
MTAQRRGFFQVTLLRCLDLQQARRAQAKWLFDLLRAEELDGVLKALRGFEFYDARVGCGRGASPAGHVQDA